MSTAPPSDRPFQVGTWQVDVPRHRLIGPGAAGNEVRLEPKAMAVLACLAGRRGEVVAKEDIVREVWGDAFVTDQVLTNAIWELRRALGDDARGQRFIQTVPRHGYRLAAQAASAPDDESPEPPSRPRRGLWWGGIALAAAVLAWTLWRSPNPPERDVTRFSVEFQEPLAALYLPAAALSADGTRLVFVSEESGTTRLYLRPMDRLEATPLAGTEGAHAPFFSPDGEWIGFYAEGELRKVPAGGGTAVTIHPAGTPRGAAWGDDGNVYFTPGSAGEIWRVPAGGGEAERVTTLEGSEWSHRWPEVLPGSGEILFTVADGDLVTGFDEAKIAIFSPRTGERRTLVDGGSFPRFVDGHLVFAREAALVAAPLDAEGLKLGGPPRVVLDGVRRFPINGAAQFAFGRDGSLAYVPGGSDWEPPRHLLRVRRDGGESPVTERQRLYYDPALSPDGRRLAVAVAERGNSDLWVLDVERDTLTRLTDTPGEEQGPIWTADGLRIAYHYSLHGPFQMFWKPADGSGEAEPLLESEHSQRPEAFSPDGKHLIFSERRSDTGFDLRILPADSSAAPRPLLVTRFDEIHARLSPDGRWLAYVSDEGGTRQLYLRPFDAASGELRGGKLQLTSAGGDEPLWDRGGGRLVYRTADAVMEVELTLEASPVAGEPRRLFPWAFPSRVFESGYRRKLDLFANGDLLLIRPGAAEPRRLHVVLGWSRELARAP